jgi:hypothetical protein
VNAAKSECEMGVVRVQFRRFLTHFLEVVTERREMDAIIVLTIVSGRVLASRCFSAPR